MTLIDEASPPLQLAPLLQARPAAGSRFVSKTLWLQGCILLALVHVLLAGYHINIGNQTIQIPFLKRWINPALYPNDPTIATISDYPTFFFRGLAYPARLLGVERTYLLLHLLTAFLVLAAVYALAKAMFRDVLAGVILVAMLFAGHHHALAGDELYSPGFTHTWAAFPIAIGVLILLYRDRAWLAFVLAGVLFNLHALTAAYLLAMLLVWAVWEHGTNGWTSRGHGRAAHATGEGHGRAAHATKRWRGWLKVAMFLASFVAAASPTLRLMVQHPQQFGADWVAHTYIRSADHSFPSSWWQPGTKDIPEFALLVGLWAISMSFPLQARQRRKTLAIAGAVGIMFLVGYVFADMFAVKIVLRAQLYRSSRLLIVIMLTHIAYAAAYSIRLALSGKSIGWRLAGVLEIVAAGTAVLCLALPPLEPFLPLALAAGAAVAIINGRLSWIAATAVAAVSLTLLLSWHHIGFDIPGIGARSWQSWQRWPLVMPGAAFWLGLGCGIGLCIVARLSPGPNWRGVILLLGVPTIALLGRSAYLSLFDSDRSDPETLAWVDVQRWAKENTPADAIFLTPPQTAKGGFRVFSERPVVCEWRDGTQLYFSGDFDEQWWKRLNAVGDLMLDTAGRHIVSRRSLDDLPDGRLMELARDFGAKYIVLPKDAKKNGRELSKVFENARWAVYRPQWAQQQVVDAQTHAAAVPPNADPRRWNAQEDFIRRTANANIEKYRKGSAHIEIVDAAGRPIESAAYDIQLVKHAFKFGASLPFFQAVEGNIMGDYKPPPVTPQELQRFLEVFNYTVIPFSAKWGYIEPREGQRHYEELDKYVDWCTRNGIDMEFHFLSGLPPAWLSSKPGNVQSDLYRKHARDLVDRYADRISSWQVMNDRWLVGFAGLVVKDIRQSHPNLSLGISDCTSFANSPASGGYLGLAEVKALAAQNAPLDYYASHGHAPHGLWAEPQQMYEMFDTFAAQGVRVRITEFQVPMYYVGDAGSVRNAMGVPPPQPAPARAGRGGAPPPPSARQPASRPAARGAATAPAAVAARAPAPAPPPRPPAAPVLQPYDIRGPIFRNGKWDHQNRADFFERFYTVAFSHPDVEAINYWNLGPASLEPGSGLLDEKYEPTPEFLRLKELIKERWTTKLAGKLADDGSVSFRGFFGDYQITITGPSGRRIEGKFSIRADAGNNLRLRLDEAKGTIEIGQ